MPTSAPSPDTPGASVQVLTENEKNLRERTRRAAEEERQIAEEQRISAEDIRRDA